MYKAQNIATYIIQYATNKGKNITNLKLQKVLYYVQGYFLKEYEKPAFNDEIKNWTYGPVVPSVYYNYCSYGSEPLKENDNETFGFLSNDHKKLLNNVINSCLDIPSFKLVEQTHSEAPWKNSSWSGLISRESILKYFANNDPLKLGEVK